MKKFNLLVCGGTFDHFHKGHREFLKFAFSLSSRIVIGLTSDDFVRKKNGNKSPESYQRRKETLAIFVKSENLSNRAEIVEINDIFGPTLLDKIPFDSILVTEETKKNAEKINEERKKLNLAPLQIIIFSPVLSNDNKLISSDRIRMGQINREGKTYIDVSMISQNLLITDELRKELKKPFGFLIKDLKEWVKSSNGLKSNLLVTVGDEVTRSFNSLHLEQQLSVIDFKIGRKEKFSNFSELGFMGGEKIMKVENPAGGLKSELFKCVSRIFEERKKRTIIKIEGEEDLAVLPLVLAAPLGFKIFYGQPNEGVVLVNVTESSKEKADALIRRFKIQKEPFTRGY